MVLVIAVVIILAATQAVENRHINICESSDPKLLGIYLPGAQMDGVATFSNENDFTFYRNKGFWYLGDLSVWPPNTYYRCVLDCPEGDSFPPSSDAPWSANKKFGKDPVPTISHAGECSVDNEL